MGQTVGDKVHPRRALRKRWVVFLLLALSALFVPTRSASALQEGAAMLLQEAGTAGSGLVTNPPVTTTMLHVVASPMSRSAELRLAGRLVYASLLGATVGKERSGKQHHPAGVRTMALVSLGAATFTLCSMYGFGGRHDPSRMASNVASGVGFIGAGVITTTAGKEESEDGGSSIVHGLTTAAAIWLSAAVGVGCGVGMCVLSTTAAILTITILRIGRVAQNLQETKRKFALQQQAAVSLLTTRRVYPDPLLLRALRRDMRRSSKSKRSEKYQEKEGTDESETIQKSNVNIHQNDLDFYEEKEDQFVFHGQRPENGWNETDKMDA